MKNLKKIFKTKKYEVICQGCGKRCFINFQLKDKQVYSCSKECTINALSNAIDCT